MRHFLFFCLLLCFAGVAHAQDAPVPEMQEIKPGTSLMYRITPKNGGGAAYDLIITFKKVGDEIYCLHMNPKDPKSSGSILQKAKDVDLCQNIGFLFESGATILDGQSAVFLPNKNFLSKLFSGIDATFNGQAYKALPIKPFPVEVDGETRKIPALGGMNDGTGSAVYALPTEPFPVIVMYEDVLHTAELIRIASK